MGNYHNMQSFRYIRGYTNYEKYYFLIKSLAYSYAWKPAVHRSANTTSTTRYHSKGGSTPPCGQPTATVAFTLQKCCNTCTVLFFMIKLIHLLTVGSHPRFYSAVSINRNNALSTASFISR